MKPDTHGYLSTSSKVSKKSNNSIKLLCSMILAAILGTLFLGSAAAAQQEEEAEALDWTQWIMCNVMPDPSKDLYQYSQSSDFWYETRSKSTMNGNVAYVDSGLNWILDLFGPGFKEVNEQILGYSLDTVEDPDAEETDDEDASEKFNKGTKVNVLDRFGVAGMSFSSYQGEWKYILIDACSSDTDPKDPRAGLYYEDRMEPRSTWEYIPTSSDPRTVQFDRGILVHYWTSIVNVIANAIFWLTKVIVVITIGLIGLSLSDLVDILGINDFIGSDGGIFDTLFTGLFEPLVFLAFVATAIKIFYEAIVKRRYRESLLNLLRSLVLFVLAFVIATNPSFWMSLPNNIAIVGQSVILTTMSGNLPNNGGMCETDIGNYKLGDGETNTIEESNNLLNQASENMRSAVSCQFWQAFLFRPWVQGQFGADWKLLFANDEIPDWVEKDESAELGNLNGETVGDAAVPMGDGTFINNWAIYQLSTQTNVHAPTGEDKAGEKSKYTSGVANDWWRIVDALSNYDEEIKKTDLVVSSGVSGTGEVATSGEYVFPIANVNRSSSYGMRVHPVTGQSKLHAGNDYSAPTGTPLYAVADGTVELTSSSTGGNKIHLQGVDGWEYRYLHLSAYSVKNGDTVTAGQEIGKVGSTGRVTGAHLHFETRQGGEPQDVNERLTAMGFDPETGSGEGSAQSSSGGAGTTTTQPYEYGVPKNNPVTSYWDTWVGNNSFGRIWASMSSVLIALIGLSAPLVLSAMAAIYSIGTAILMAFAPIFLLLGCWAGRGWELFKGWGELVVNTTLKRIIVGLLLALSMSFVTTAIDIMENVGWFQGVIVMALLSILLLNSREKLVNMMANIRFASSDLSGTANRMSGILKQQTIGRAKTVGKDTALMTGSVGASAIGAKRAGGTFKEGAIMGAKKELKNLTYRKPSLDHARISYENAKIAGNMSEERLILDGQAQCAACKKDLEYEMAQNGTGIFRGGRTPQGNLLCEDCFLDNVRPGSDEVEHIHTPSEKSLNEKQEKERQELYKRAFSASSNFNDVQQKGKNFSSRLRKELELDQKQWNNPDKLSMSPAERAETLGRLANVVHYDIEDYKQKVDAYRNSNDKDATIPMSPEIAEIVKPYIDKNVMATAWVHEKYDYIVTTYTTAFYVWYKEQIGKDLNMDWQDFYLMVQNKEVGNRSSYGNDTLDTRDELPDSDSEAIDEAENNEGK